MTINYVLRIEARRHILSQGRYCVALVCDELTGVQRGIHVLCYGWGKNKGEAVRDLVRRYKTMRHAGYHAEPVFISPPSIPPCETMAGKRTVCKSGVRLRVA
jgi:hypothetical protein